MGCKRWKRICSLFEHITDRDRLRDEKRLLLERREEHTELVAEVRKDRTLAERKAEVGLLTKMKWTLVGIDTDEED